MIPEELLQAHIQPLKMGDSFCFHCTQCGACCYHHFDILLSPYDLFHLANGLHIPPEEIIHKYCDIYIGSTSSLPILQLKPIGKEEACPFIQNHLCIVHDFKPTVCALYPLGRVAGWKEENKDDGIPFIAYYKLPVRCGTKEEKFTLKEWLENNHLIESNQWFVPWQQTILLLFKDMMGLKKKLPQKYLTIVQECVFQQLYLRYDLTKDFMGQFKEKSKVLLQAVQNLVDMTRNLPDTTGETEWPEEKEVNEKEGNADGDLCS